MLKRWLQDLQFHSNFKGEMIKSAHTCYRAVQNDWLPLISTDFLWFPLISSDFHSVCLNLILQFVTMIGQHTHLGRGSTLMAENSRDYWKLMQIWFYFSLFLCINNAFLPHLVISAWQWKLILKPLQIEASGFYFEKLLLKQPQPLICSKLGKTWDDFCFRFVCLEILLFVVISLW